MLNTYISACILNEVLGLGLSDCDLKSLGDVYGVIPTSKNVKFAKTMTNAAFQTAYNNYILSGDIVPLGQVFNFEQTTPENETATSSLGIKSDIRAGKPEFSFIYDRSTCFDNNLSKLAERNWNLILCTEKGTLLTEDASGDYLKGFDTGYSSKTTFKLQAGTDPQQSKIMFQYSPTGAHEFNFKKVVLDTLAIGFNPFDYNAPIGTNITINNTSVTTSSTDLDVTIVSACSGTPILGLSDEAFYGLVGQSITVASVTDNGSGNYTLTLSASPSAGTIQVALSNGTYFAIEDANGVKYTGKSNVKTVA